jgi:adenosylcobinamide kinase/adenosylcobinamide-phosphate guanylyltransferase
VTRRRVLIGGGVRCGKSAFALRRARELGERRVLVATAEALDEEMRERVVRHRAERGDAFRTLEEPIELASAIAGLRDIDVAVVDCLTIWLSNLLLRGDGPVAILARIDELGRVLDDAPCHVVLVTNEVGFGIVPDNALARSFRDLAGAAHQRLAARCDEVYLGALGMILRLRPEPFAIVPPAAEAPPA